MSTRPPLQGARGQHHTGSSGPRPAPAPDHRRRRRRRPPSGRRTLAVFGNIDSEGTRLTTLADRAAMTAQAMGELVDDLVAKGYLTRVADPSDRRAKLTALTDRGRGDPGCLRHHRRHRGRPEAPLGRPSLDLRRALRRIAGEGAGTAWPRRAWRGSCRWRALQRHQPVAVGVHHLDGRAAVSSVKVTPSVPMSSLNSVADTRLSPSLSSRAGCVPVGVHHRRSVSGGAAEVGS